jgi:hypothetical protein
MGAFFGGEKLCPCSKKSAEQRKKKCKFFPCFRKKSEKGKKKLRILPETLKKSEGGKNNHFSSKNHFMKNAAQQSGRIF